MKRLSLILPDELHEALKKLAQSEHRSLHAQIIFILEKYLKQLMAEQPKG